MPGNGLEELRVTMAAGELRECEAQMIERKSISFGVR